MKNIKIIIGNLGVFIYIEFNEILGDYLRTILSKITKINYISQRSPISENKSSECIEFLLFKQRISNFSLIQLIYILDVNNYNINFRTFRKNFQNISNYIPSNICKDILLEINIKLILSNIKKEQFFACLFNKNNISNNYFSLLINLIFYYFISLIFIFININLKKKICSFDNYSQLFILHT